MIGKKQLETKLEYTRTGIILFTTEYQACVEFYSNVLELPVMFTADNEHSKLTCCGMGGSYLMIETSGPPPAKLKTLEQNPFWLRFNVKDVEAATERLRSKGVEVTLRREVWGTVAHFADPDGNGCSFRDEDTFGA